MSLPRSRSLCMEIPRMLLPYDEKVIGSLAIHDPINVRRRYLRVSLELHHQVRERLRIVVLIDLSATSPNILVQTITEILALMF